MSLPTRHPALYMAIASVIFIVSSAWHSPPAIAAPWQVGVAKAVITPAEPMWMAGYAARNRPSEGKLNELNAKVLVIRPGANGPDTNRTNPTAENAAAGCGVLITLDLVGIDRELSSSICRTLLEKHGLARRQIAICTSHTHSGPVVGRNLRPLHLELLDAAQQQLVTQYANHLERTVVDLVTGALGNMQACELAWGTGHAAFAVNRRNNPEPSVPERRAAGTLVGPFDHDVPVLTARTSADHRLLAIVFGYACHATVLDGYDWCGDYPGFAQDELEAAFPGTTAMFWAGCGGDQNPIPRRQVELVKQYGQELAEAVQSVVAAEVQPLAGQLSMQYAEIPLALDALPTAAQLAEEAQSNNRHVAARARILLSKLESGTGLDQDYPYPVGRWDLGGSVEFIFLGGETVVDYALRIKSELHGPRTWVAGYTNDVMAYIPSRRVLGEGGYEGGGAMIYYGLPTVWSPEVEQTIVAEVRRQAKAAR